MTRFVTMGSSLTSVGSTSPVGMKDISVEDDRGLLQIDSSLGNPFEVRIFATLVFDFTTNQGAGWHDVTSRLRTIGDSGADFVLVGGVWQKRKADNATSPLDVPGIYALDVGYFPAAIYAGIISAPTSGHLDLHFGF